MLLTVQSRFDCLFQPCKTGRKALVVPRCTNKQHPGTRYDDNAFVRTNVLADYIDKLTNDINMVTLGDDGENEHQCKYIAMVHCLIIIAILVFMFLDKNNDKPDDF